MRKMTNFAHEEMRDSREHFSREADDRKSSETFANFLVIFNSLIIRWIDIIDRYKTRHLSLKKYGICEKCVREASKSFEINALGLKKRHSMTRRLLQSSIYRTVVEAYRLDRYDNTLLTVYWRVITKL